MAHATRAFPHGLKPGGLRRAEAPFWSNLFWTEH